MATSRETIKSDYPLPVFNYKVEIDGETIGFSEVSGLEIVYETITYMESPVGEGTGPNMMFMPGMGTPVNVTLSKGYVRSSNINILYNWLVGSEDGIRSNTVTKKDIFVRLCDEEGNPVVTWTVKDAFPTKLTAPSFNASSNEIAIESLELMASDLTMEEA